MECWHFSEFPYPHFPADEPQSRINLPSKHFDPAIGADLYNRYLDEHCLADELGLNIMLNEHHQTPTCLNAAAPLSAAILARQTRNARICILGNPIAHRNDPIRIAEEMAMVDCISRGRLECGFVRGVPYEIFASNCNPAETVDRLWEGVDLVIRAWTTVDGPFNYEGRFWQRRSINVWPRPLQKPYPRIWITSSSDTEGVTRMAERGYVFAIFLQPWTTVKAMFDVYRSHFVERGLPGGGGMAYMPLVFTGDSEEDAEKGAAELRWYLTGARSPAHYRSPPGYLPLGAMTRMMRSAALPVGAQLRGRGLDALREEGILFYGTPDTMVKQIRAYYDKVGGFDHLLMMQQAGFMSHERTARSMTLFAKEVYPRIRDLAPTRATERAKVAAE
ncbi:MAG TPA: LLM class flavin-dependent oxidoreductase [Stellaceae bacterium]|nr:LLM class flavin-dependent oxidoreductase [Stellaceae bacterium]